VGKESSKEGSWTGVTEVVYHFWACQDVGVSLAVGCLVLKTSDREGVEIHNFDRRVSRRRVAQERGIFHYSLTGIVASKCFLNPGNIFVRCNRYDVAVD
jgi:hypothetical protein